MSAPFTGWPPRALDWFRELEANNNRSWFQENRRRYDTDVRGPLEAVLAELGAEFGEGTVSRPNRDIRFSSDKSPYKLQIYARVPRPLGGGGWYVQLRREGLYVGGGLFAPDPGRLARLRSAIADDRSGPELEKVAARLRAGGLELMDGGALKGAPRGYAVDHPRIALLRLVHLAAGTLHTPGAWLHSAAAKDRIVTGWHAVTPLLEWVAAQG